MVNTTANAVPEKNTNKDTEKIQKIEKEIIVSYWIYYSNLILQFLKESEIRMQKRWKNT